MIKRLVCLLILFFSYEQCFAQGIDLKSARNIRDPFKVKYRKKLGNKRARTEKFTGFSNRASTENLSIDRLKVTGIFMGKNPRAMVQEILDQTTNKVSEDVVIIKEGMKIGPDQVEVKAILPGGVVLVEKIINVYDEEEYLETILPLSD